MKRILVPTMIVLAVFLAACGSDVAIDPEAVATQASNVVSEARDAVEGVGETEATEPTEQSAAASETEVTCDPADIPAPSGEFVNVRFVNNSGGEMSLIWHDMEQTPTQLTEYTKLANGESYDQLTYTGHEWLMEGADGHLLKMYTASADETQCVVVYPHFGYEGEDGPENWAELSASYHTCGLGQEQSPIDLTSAAMTDLDNIVFEYGETAVNILNNGHTIQVDKVQDSRILIKDAQSNDIPFSLLQFHFHSPSEHAVDGQQYPIEMHLVHKAADGRLAVVGVFIIEGAENRAFTPVWDHLPEEENGTIVTGAAVQVASLLPEDQTIYRYNGSLTTPPCSEQVIWSVMKNPVEMSAEQIAAFTAIIEGNNRPLQPLNARALQLDETP